MEYITKTDLEEYIALLTNDEGKLYANDLLEYLDKVKLKQDLEVDRSQFGSITTMQEAERMLKVIDLLEELEELWSYYFAPKDFVIDLNDSSHVLDVRSVIFDEVIEFGKRELIAYNKRYKIKPHTLVQTRIKGLEFYEVAADKY